jgi:predicted nucleotidyltransferase
MTLDADSAHRAAGAAGAEARIADWCRAQGIGLAMLFGSRARGDARTGSDWDLAVWSDGEPTAAERLEWASELAAAAGAEVQIVVVTPALDPVLGMQIAREGRVLVEASPGRAISERVRLWHLYQDSQPFLARARRELARYAQEVRDGS